MNESSKIVEMRLKKGGDDRLSRKNEEIWTSDVDVHDILKKVLDSLGKLESDWEIDHSSPTIRDEFCLLRYYLDTLRKYLAHRSESL